MAIIDIKNLNFGYDDILIFNNFNLSINKGSWTTIIGPNGSGKSTLVRLLTGLVRTNSPIKIDDLLINEENLDRIRMSMGVIFENPDNQFVGETVRDDLAFSLENIGYSSEEINKKIRDISRKLGITSMLDSTPEMLSGGQKQIVSLASVLIYEPKILILDEAFGQIEDESANRILSILSNLHKKTDLTIINVTHNMEETLYGDNIIVLNQGKIVLNGSKEKVLKSEKQLTKLGIELPFMASLSLKLMFYNLIDDMILDMNEMVDKLWK